VCGEWQVAGAELALAHGNGGVLSSQCTVIMGGRGRRSSGSVDWGAGR